MTIEELQAENARLKAENARLKTEVQHLMVFCNCTLIPNKELQAEVERLTKAGDAMVPIMAQPPHKKGSHSAMLNWFAAKEGKQSK